MATIRFEDLEDGMTLEDMRSDCYGLDIFLSKEDSEEIKRRFKEYHRDNPNYKEMPMWKFIYENVEVKIK